jgi:hypothetical protein
MHLRAAVLPSKCACFRSCREKGRRATGFGEGERQERRETVVRRGTWAANLGRRAGMAPIAGLCRGQGKGSTVRLRGPNTACTVRQGKGKGKERQRRTRFARAPRVSQPAEPAQAGGNQWIHPSSVPARRRSGRRKMPNPAGLVLATGDASQPLMWLRPSGLDPDQLCQRTRHLEPVLVTACPTFQLTVRATCAAGGGIAFCGHTYQRCIRLRLF